MYVYECFVYMYTCIPEEGTGSHGTTVISHHVVDGIELNTSARAASTVNH